MRRTAISEPTVLPEPHQLNVLIADDDAISLRFIADGLAAFGVNAQTADEGLRALALARGHPFDLLLLDCRMPGAGAREVLHALRNDSGAASVDAIAVASSAELGAAEQRELLAQGFSDVLLKPCDLTRLREVLLLAAPARPGALMLDDAAALGASGDAATMQALRTLLCEELVALAQELPALRSDSAAFVERLHRLRSSCGFCGAHQLGSQIIGLQQHLNLTHGNTDAATRRFQRALAATLEALQPRDQPGSMVSSERPRQISY